MKKLCMALVVLLMVFGSIKCKSNQESETFNPAVGLKSEAFADDQEDDSKSSEEGGELIVPEGNSKYPDSKTGEEEKEYEDDEDQGEYEEYEE